MSERDELNYYEIKTERNETLMFSTWMVIVPLLCKNPIASIRISRRGNNNTYIAPISIRLFFKSNYCTVSWAREMNVDTRSVEKIIVRGQNMQICHSLRRKQVDMSTADQSLSTFRNNTGTHLLTFRSKCRDVEFAFVFSSRKFRPILVVVSSW